MAIETDMLCEMKDIYMSWLMEINDDFDDDLLMDVMELLEASAEEWFYVPYWLFWIYLIDKNIKDMEAKIEI
jgi:hypothetical protein